MCLLKQYVTLDENEKFSQSMMPRLLIHLQIPCFFLWLTTIRRMSLDNHPGFDCVRAYTVYFLDIKIV